MILTESMPLLPAIDADMIIVDKDFDADERVIQARCHKRQGRVISSQSTK